MINFFRKIRKQMANDNKPLKYFRYAIGEIVLVVIGILIALQVNTLNESRKEQAQLRTYVSSLREDLENDISMVEVIIFQSEEIISRIDSLCVYVQNKKIDDLSNLDLLCFTLNKPHRPYKWNRATLDELKSSGSLRIIKNDSLIKRIAKYDAETSHLDEDYENDKLQFEKCTQLMSLVVNTNYSNFDTFYEMLLPGDNRRSYDLFSSKQYKIAKEQNLDIITNNIDDIYKMVNGYNVLKSYLKIRTDDELPKLIKDIELLISALKDTYEN